MPEIRGELFQFVVGQVQLFQGSEVEKRLGQRLEAELVATEVQMQKVVEVAKVGRQFLDFVVGQVEP